MKGVLLKSIENEKEVMFTDFQLLSEEVVERDLIIQSLNKVFDEKEEDVAFMLDMTSNVSVSGKPFTSTSGKRKPGGFKPLLRILKCVYSFRRGINKHRQSQNSPTGL